MAIFGGLSNAAVILSLNVICYNGFFNANGKLTTGCCFLNSLRIFGKVPRKATHFSVFSAPPGRKKAKVKASLETLGNGEAGLKLLLDLIRSNLSRTRTFLSMIQ